MATATVLKRSRMGKTPLQVLGLNEQCYFTSCETLYFVEHPFHWRHRTGTPHGRRANDHQTVLGAGDGYIDPLWITEEADVLVGVVADHREHDDAVLLTLVAVHGGHRKALPKSGGPFG